MVRYILPGIPSRGPLDPMEHRRRILPRAGTRWESRLSMFARAQAHQYDTLTMRPTELRKLLKTEPFEPIRLGLSDGRAVTIRHPDQAVVAERHLLVGLATIERSGPLATPRSGQAIARDWLIVNLLHIATVEPADGSSPRSKRKPRR